MTMQRLNPGPVDGSVLTLQHQHRSSAIWNKMDRGILHCRRRGAFRKSMCNPDKRIKEHLVASGFYGLHLIQFIKLDHALITALAERWRQETHTFHLAVGEATVTLQDVAILTGLPIDGLPIVGTGAETMTAASMCETYLGSLPPQHCIKGYCVKLAWLTETFAVLPENADDTLVECYARAYILLLMSGTLFSDRTQNWINLKYLNFLKDLKKAREYSWGSAGLGLLYRELCRATSPDASDICGPLILLQLWAWERFPNMRPTRMNDPPPTPEGFPRGPLGYRWCAELSMRNISTNVLWVYRNQLDQQKENQITWEPYDAEVIRQLPDYCLTGSHIWRSKCPLIYYGIVELHLPDRVLRQFGLRQKIPLPCDTLLSLHDIDRFGKTHVNWIEWHGEWISMWEKRHELVVEGKPSKHPMKKDDPYMLWYNRITRRFIGPLDDGPSQRYQEYGARYASTGQVLQNIVDQAKYASAVDDIGTYKRLCQYIMTVGELEMNRYHGVQSHREAFEEASAQQCIAISSESDADENGLDLNGSGSSDASSSQGTASHLSTRSSGSTQDSSGQSGSTEPDSSHSKSTNQRHSSRPFHTTLTANRSETNLPGHSQPVVCQPLSVAPVINPPAARTASKSVCSWPGFTGHLASDKSPAEQSSCSWPVASFRKARKSQAAAEKAADKPVGNNPTTDEPAADQAASSWPATHHASLATTTMTASEQVAIGQNIEKQIATSQTSSKRRTVSRSNQGATTRAAAKRAATISEGKAKNDKRASKRKASQPNSSQAAASYNISFTGSGHHPMPLPMPPIIPSTTTPAATSTALSSSPMPFYWLYPMHPSMYSFTPPTPSQFKSGRDKKSSHAPDNAPEASKKRKHHKDKASKAAKEKNNNRSPSYHSKKPRLQH